MAYISNDTDTQVMTPDTMVGSAVPPLPPVDNTPQSDKSKNNNPHRPQDTRPHLITILVGVVLGVLSMILVPSLIDSAQNITRSLSQSQSHSQSQYDKAEKQTHNDITDTFTTEGLVGQKWSNAQTIIRSRGEGNWLKRSYILTDDGQIAINPSDWTVTDIHVNIEGNLVVTLHHDTTTADKAKDTAHTIGDSIRGAINTAMNR